MEVTALFGGIPLLLERLNEERLRDLNGRFVSLVWFLVLIFFWFFVLLSQYYNFTLSRGQGFYLSVEQTQPDNDIDLYIRYNNYPNFIDYDYDETSTEFEFLALIIV